MANLGIAMKRVIELVRVSTDAQAGEDRAGIPAQRAANRRTAQQYGLEIVRSIEMVDVSGAAVLQAPQMQELFRLMEAPDIDGVVTKEFSRLMRPGNYADYAILQQFVDTNTVLYLPDGPMDFAVDSGQLMGPMRAAIAGWERRAILDRMWRAKEEKRKRGEHVQSSACLPFGVACDDKGWRYTADAELVREAFSRLLSGEHSYAELGEPLGMSPDGIRALLQNPIWIGWRVIDRRRDGKKRKIRRAPEDIIRVKVMDGLIPQPDFDRAQALIESKRARHWKARTDHAPQFTYNGFLSCGHCSDPLHTFHRGEGFYVCRRRRKADGSCPSGFMPRAGLEAELDSLFSERLTSPDFLAEVAAQTMKESGAGTSAHQAIRAQAELKRLAASRQKVLDLYCDGVLGRKEFDARLAKVDAQRLALERIVSESRPAPEVSAESLAELFMVFYEWKHLGREDKRSILATMMPEIRIVDSVPDRLSILACNEPSHVSVGRPYCTPQPFHLYLPRAA